MNITKTLRIALTATVMTTSVAVGAVVAPTAALAAPTRQSIVAIAQRELADASRNYEVGTNCSFYGGEMFGWPACGGKPGWGGGGSAYAWCAAFAKYVWREAGVTSYLSELDGYAQSFKDYGVNHGTWHARGSYVPQPGDAIVFDNDHLTGDAHPMDHVGIVKSVSGSTLYTIEGNSSDKVSARTYSSYASNGDIIGFITPVGITGSTAGTVRDFDGDGKADVFARNASSQDLLLYQGNGAGGFLTGTGGVIGNNWSSFDVVMSAGDWDRDGDQDIIARNKTSYDLYLYKGNGSGSFQTGTGTLLGSNWSNFDTIFGAGDWDSDGDQDIIARNKTNHDLYLYKGNGSGGFQAGTGTVIGSNWAAHDLLFSAGDFSGDGKPDILARNATSKDLHLYKGNGAGGFQTGTGDVIGNNWANLDVIFSAGDFDGDGDADILARNSDTADLHLYEGNGIGGFQTGTGNVAGNNWGNLDRIF